MSVKEYIKLSRNELYVCVCRVESGEKGKRERGKNKEFTRTKENKKKRERERIVPHHHQLKGSR